MTEAAATLPDFAPKPASMLSKPTDRFYCSPYRCVMAAQGCVERQATVRAGMKLTEFGKCINCPLGVLVEKNSGARADKAEKAKEIFDRQHRAGKRGSRTLHSEKALDDLDEPETATVETVGHSMEEQAPVEFTVNGPDQAPVAKPKRVGRPAGGISIDDDWVREALTHHMGILRAREGVVMRRRYVDGASMVEIARELGVSAARITQIKGEAIDRLRLRVKLTPHSFEVSPPPSRETQPSTPEPLPAPPPLPKLPPVVQVVVPTVAENLAPVPDEQPVMVARLEEKKEKPMSRCTYPNCKKIVRLGKLKEKPAAGTEGFCKEHRDRFLKTHHQPTPIAHNPKVTRKEKKAVREAGASAPRDYKAKRPGTILVTNILDNHAKAAGARARAAIAETNVEGALAELREAHELVSRIGWERARALAATF